MFGQSQPIRIGNGREFVGFPRPEPAHRTSEHTNRTRCVLQKQLEPHRSAAIGTRLRTPALEHDTGRRKLDCVTVRCHDSVVDQHGNVGSPAQANAPLRSGGGCRAAARCAARRKPILIEHRGAPVRNHLRRNHHDHDRGMCSSRANVTTSPTHDPPLLHKSPKLQWIRGARGHSVRGWRIAPNEASSLSAPGSPGLSATPPMQSGRTAQKPG